VAIVTSRSRLKTGIGIAGVVLLALPLMTVAVDARGGFGGHGGGFGGGHMGGFGGGHIGGFGGGRIGGFGGGHIGGVGRIGGFGGGHIGGVGRIGGFGGGRIGGIGRIGGFSGRVGGFSRIGGTGLAGRGGGIAVRSFGGNRFSGVGRGTRSFAGGRSLGRSVTTSRIGVGAGRLAGAGNRFATARTLGAAGTRVRGVFGNRAIANAAFRSHFGFARFRGRFFGSPWPWWWGGLTIGWVGPVFWPYAYYDFFDYVFWPYAYDDFWPYAYDDVYYGIYGPYAYGGPPVVAAPGSGANMPSRSAGAAGRHIAKARGAEARAADVCSSNAADLTDWPIERISEIVQPTDAQRPLLDEMRAASAKAVDLLKAGCPRELPSTPTGRLAAMESRLQVMLQAVQTVRLPLERFYQSLTDEQKARFNAVAPATDTAAASEDQRDLTKFCDERAPGVTDLPIDRIAQAVRPTSVQRTALDELKDASVKAAEGLKASCPTYQALTPTGRVEAMEKRLEATLAAVRTVQPALVKFYDGLTDEQKARFNSLRSASRPVG
jgi:hypothetical protein